MTKPVEAVLMGTGNRGQEVYGAYALVHPDRIRFVAVAEPHDVRRTRFAEAHSIPPDRQFRTWEDLLAQRQLADAALICTQDTAHIGPAVAALQTGYDVLLEKPMATTVGDCVRLVQVAEETGRLLLVCYALRYTAFFSAVHDLIASGRLGRVVTVEHRENVSYWHMAHSFVRGKWGKEGSSSPMILAKCCHDLDLLYWYLGRCTHLSSVGSLLHFRPENAPPGAPARCTDGCPHASACPWFAPRLYLDLVPLLRMARHSTRLLERVGASLALDHPRFTHWTRRLFPALDRALDYRGWPVSVLSEDTSLAARRHALESGPYGRCVYRCDNDVVDHQIVNMRFDGGVSATLVMQGHSHREGRTLRIDGTRATLRGAFYTYRQEIEVHDHLTGAVERIALPSPSPTSTGRGDGDARLMDAFCRAVREPSGSLTTAQESLESHLMAFAAERARKRQCVVAMDAYRRWAWGIGREPEKDDRPWIVA